MIEPAPWVRLYPAGVEAHIDVRHQNMLELWDDAVRRRRDEVCVFYFDAAHSYGQIDADSDALAWALLDSGFAAKDRLGIMLQNDPQWLVAVLGVWKAGGTAVSLSPMLKSRELAFQLADAGVSVLVCLDELYEDVVADAVEGTTVRRVITTSRREWLMSLAEGPAEDSLRTLVDAAAGQVPVRPPLAPDDVAALVYTSGTTGPPKGAMLTHGGLCYNSQIPVEWFHLGADEPIMGMAPLFHVTGLVLHLGISWYAGSALVLCHRFEPQSILRAVEQRRPAFAIAAITAYIALMDSPDFASYDLSSLRVAASGGAPVHTAVVTRFRAATGLTISSVYGLTETTSPTHLTPPDHSPPVDSASGALSVGVPIPGARVRVVDDSGMELPPGAIGELAVAGPMVVPGYWRQPAETAEAICHGELRTGDVATMDANGWCFIVDRKKDLIVASGYKVWPREVEEILLEHPAVREAVVAGVPDSYRGESVSAWVVLAAGSVVEDTELIEFCRVRLAAYKYPRQIRIVAEIPKTSTGKALRRELRASAQSA